MHFVAFNKFQQLGLCIALACAIFAAGHAWLDRSTALEAHDVARLTEDDTVVAIVMPVIGVPVIEYDAYTQMCGTAYTAGYVRGEHDAAVATLETLGESLVAARSESSDAIAHRLDRASEAVEARYIPEAALR